MDLLHSHFQNYSNRQLATTNEWTVLPCWDEPKENPNGEMEFLPHRIYIHRTVAPVFKLKCEVSCYGNESIGSDHDHCWSRLWTI